jgi:hypothetical protein
MEKKNNHKQYPLSFKEFRKKKHWSQVLIKINIFHEAVLINNQNCYFNTNQP